MDVVKGSLYRVNAWTSLTWIYEDQTEYSLKTSFKNKTASSFYIYITTKMSMTSLN